MKKKKKKEQKKKNSTYVAALIKNENAADKLKQNKVRVLSQVNTIGRFIADSSI